MQKKKENGINYNLFQELFKRQPSLCYEGELRKAAPLK
jgi:hypothetical protein